MKIAFRYGQEYRNVTPNQIFSKFTGRKLPVAKYSFPPLFPHTSDQIYNPKESKKKAPICKLFFAFHMYSENSYFLKEIGDNCYSKDFINYYYYFSCFIIK